MTSFATWSLLVNDWHFRAGSLPAEVKPSRPQFLCAHLSGQGSASLREEKRKKE